MVFMVRLGLDIGLFLPNYRVDEAWLCRSLGPAPIQHAQDALRRLRVAGDSMHSEADVTRIV